MRDTLRLRFLDIKPQEVLDLLPPNPEDDFDPAAAFAAAVFVWRHTPYHLQLSVASQRAML